MQSSSDLVSLNSDASIYPRGCTLIILYIRRPGSFFWVQNIEFLYFFFLGGGVQKNKYFWGMKILWIFFGGHHKT